MEKTEPNINLLPLPNPISPTPSSFLNKLIQTRKCLNLFKSWTPTTGNITPLEEGKPFLSVMVITYNHERFIRKALDSILMQQCKFPIEINVIDDASTDETQKIIREYHQLYPDIINCYFNRTNVGHIATQLNTIRGFQTLRGRYFALLEGDDYWTDPNKLSKQVDFLEKHPDYVACAHQTMKVYDDNRRSPEHFLPFKAFGRNVANIYDLITMAGAFHLSSIVYRNVFYQSPPACLTDEYSCEITINMLYGTYGNFYCFDDYMSVYRVHNEGVFSNQSQEVHWLFHLHGFRHFALYLGPKYWAIFARAVLGFSLYVLRAPYTTYEVTSLNVKTQLLFLSHLVPAAISYFFYKIFVEYTCRFSKSIMLGILKVSSHVYSFTIRYSPKPLLRVASKMGSKLPFIRSCRLALNNWSKKHLSNE